MNKFKAGDVVKCIGMDPEYGGKLDIGSFHTVTGPGLGGSDTILVDYNSLYHYHEKYFELVDRDERLRVDESENPSVYYTYPRPTLHAVYTSYKEAFRDTLALLGQVDPGGVKRIQKLHPDAFKETD